MFRPFFAVVLMLGLGACSAFDSEKEYVDPYAGRSASDIYSEGESLLAGGDAGQAAEVFSELERVHPASEWAKRAMIMSAYSYYTARDYENARQTASRFLNYYPSDQDSPYAQYIIALTYYDEIVDVGRDQSATESALRELQTVIQRYPNSDYAREAKLKLDLTLDQLAGKEMMIARYYMARGFYAAAINRLKVVLNRYQTTSHVPEALHRLVECYLSLGVPQEAQTAAAVLGYNFPGSEWYQASYAMLNGADLAPFEDKESWISKAFRQVLTGSQL